MGWLTMVLAVIQIIKAIISLIKSLKDSGKRQEQALPDMERLAVMLHDWQAGGKRMGPFQRRFFNHYLAKVQELRAAADGGGVTLLPEFEARLQASGALCMNLGCEPGGQEDAEIAEALAA